MESARDQKVERFAQGGLTAEEARELAQAALESPALFDELTNRALVKAALASVPLPAEPAPRRGWSAVLVFATVAALVAVSMAALYLWREPQLNRQNVITATSQAPAATPALKPTLTLSPESRQPVLLADDLQPATTSSTIPIFRGQQPAVRSPRQIGSVISLEDGAATIDLGSLDGISKGTEVEVVRGEGQAAVVARLRIDTVFRERARGAVSDTRVRLHDGVRVSDAVHLSAMIERVDDLERRGQAGEARKVAGDVNGWANSANVSQADRGRLLKQLARMDFRSGALDDAAAHYRAALEALSADPRATADERIAAGNDLAAIEILRGEYTAAGELLDRAAALPSSPKEQLRSDNNRGVLAEVRGDHRQAQMYYNKALQSLSGQSNMAQERRVVEANLARLTESQ